MKFFFLARPKLLSLVMEAAALLKRLTTQRIDARVRAWRARLPPHLSTRALEQADPRALRLIAAQGRDHGSTLNLLHRLKYESKMSPRAYSAEVLGELAALRTHVLATASRRALRDWKSVLDGSRL
jgi:hypothetical protein